MLQKVADFQCIILRFHYCMHYSVINSAQNHDPNQQVSGFIKNCITLCMIMRDHFYAAVRYLEKMYYRADTVDDPNNCCVVSIGFPSCFDVIYEFNSIKG